jgi:hypothetical protein
VKHNTGFRVVIALLAYCACGLGLGTGGFGCNALVVAGAAVGLITAWLPRIWVALVGVSVAACAWAAGYAWAVQGQLGWQMSVGLAIPFIFIVWIGWVVEVLVVVMAFGDHWRSRTRGEFRRCRTCGYSLVGLAKPRCPECGTPFTREPPMESDDAEMDD